MLRYALVAVVALGLCACSDREDDVLQPPAPGAAPEPVTETRAQVAMTATAVALGMTRAQLEDADLLSATNTDLGDVETLVLDAAGQATHVVVELEGPGDPKVAIPIGQVRSVKLDNSEVHLTTDLSTDQLAGLAPWTPEAAR